MKSREIMALEESLGHHFQRRELIEQALTHSSQAREVEALGAGSGSSGRGSSSLGSFSGDNEMFEFLGDAVLGLATSEALFHRFPEFQEGHLSKLRAHLVGQRHLLRVAEQLQIGHYMRLGRGEEKSGGRNKASLQVDALEAILAALYLDGGWAVARDFIVRVIVEPELAHMKLETSAMPVMAMLWILFLAATLGLLALLSYSDRISQAAVEPAVAEEDRLPDHHPDHARPLRSQRHPHRDLLPAPGGCVGEQAIESYRCQNNSQSPEKRQQERPKPWLGDRIGNYCLHRAQLCRPIPPAGR